MSLKKIIKKAKIRCNILYLDSVKGAGGQLTKEWRIRHENVPIRLNVTPRPWQMLYYDTQKVFAQTIGYLLYKTGITIRDRITCGGKTYDVKKVDNWDEQNLYQRIGLQEVKNP